MSLSASPAPKVRVEYIDGLRACAALFVTLYHIASLVDGLLVTMWGHHAVGVFIVLSGTSLMLPFARGAATPPGWWRRFFVGRIRRILPPYFCAVLFALGIRQFGLSHPLQDSVGVWDIVSHFLLIHNFWRKTCLSIAGPFWSIAVEWQIYFLFPALVWLWGKYGGLKATALFAVYAAALTALLMVTRVINTGWHGAMTHYIVLFALGSLAAGILFSDAPPLSTLRSRVPWGILASALFVVIVGCYKLEFWVSYYRFLASDMVVGAFGVCLVICGQSGRLNKILCGTPLLAVGAFSYSLYLIHQPVLWVLWQWIVEPLHLGRLVALAVLAVLAVPACLLAAYLFYLAFERPFLSASARAYNDAVHGRLIPVRRPSWCAKN